jgi:hypothetical protein
MSVAAQQRKSSKALRERWGFWYGYWSIVLAWFGTGYLLEDHHHEYLASAADLVALISLASGMWFLKWSRSARYLLSLLLLIGFAVFDWKWLSETTKGLDAPNMTGWGSYTTGCIAEVNASRLLDFQNTHRLYLACQIVDPTIDPLEDTRISISQPFHIVKDSFKIIVNYDRDSPMALLSKTAKQGHLSLFILPNNVDVSGVNKLSDVPRLGGTAWPSRDPTSAISR